TQAVRWAYRDQPGRSGHGDPTWARTTRSRRRHRAAGFVLGLVSAAPSLAQAYPEKPIKLIVTFPPGGPMDTMARLVAHHLTIRFNQPVVVENMAGGPAALRCRLRGPAQHPGLTRMWWAPAPPRRPPPPLSPRHHATPPTPPPPA